MKKKLWCLVLVAILLVEMMAGTAPRAEASSAYDANTVVTIANGFLGYTNWKNLCLAFVEHCFNKAYGFSSSACCAYKYGSSYIDSTSRNDIPLGADVYFGGSDITCGSCGSKCGHIGIYVGDGYIIHSWSGKVQKTTIDYVINCGYPYRGYGWHGNKELSVGYLSRCTKYPTYVAIQVAGSTTFKTLPCSAGTDASSKDIRNGVIGEELSATALYKNSAGNYWYQVDVDGKTGYVFAGDVYTKGQYSDASISGVAAPSSLKQGDRFSIKGVITASKVELVSVAGYVFSGADTNRVAVCSKSVGVSANYYSLLNSEIDYAMTFNELTPGNYTYAIQITYRTYFSEDGTSLSETGAVKTLVEQPFTVTGSGSCTNHSYDNACDTSCNVCGSTRTTSHTWNNGTINKKPTCVAEGVKTYTCTVCSIMRTEALAKTEDHLFDGWGGPNLQIHVRSCERCGLLETESHTWKEYQIVKAPTCKEEGSVTYVCTKCAITDFRTISKTKDHSYDNNCDTSCNICGSSRTASHTWNGGKVTKQPNCKTEGVKMFTCTACGKTRTEAVAKTTKHSFDDSCDASCNVCGHTRTVAHSPGQSATATTGQVCTVCGIVLSPATGEATVPSATAAPQPVPATTADSAEAQTTLPAETVPVQTSSTKTEPDDTTATQPIKPVIYPSQSGGGSGNYSLPWGIVILIAAAAVAAGFFLGKKKKG